MQALIDKLEEATSHISKLKELLQRQQEENKNVKLVAENKQEQIDKLEVKLASLFSFPFYFLVKEKKKKRICKL